MTDSKIASSTAPSQGTNYNGLVVANTKNHVMRGADCWLNVYLLMQVRRDYEAAGNPAWEDAARGIWDKVTWHEAGHWAWGLQDDRNSRTPGMMVYKAMLARPNDYELATIKWMYQ